MGGKFNFTSPTFNGPTIVGDGGTMHVAAPASHGDLRQLLLRLRAELGDSAPAPADSAAVDTLIRTLESAAAGQGAAAAVPADLLRALAGRTLTEGRSVLTFGPESQLGDVSIGDVAGGTMIKVTLNVCHGGGGTGA